MSTTALARPATGKRSKNASPLTTETKLWRPRTSEELRDRIISDPAYFAERCCSIRDSLGRGLVPFRFNSAQRRYYESVWRRGVSHDIVGKSRKWGFTTLRCLLALHGVMYRRGRSARLVAQRQETSLEVAKTVKLLYESAWDYFERIGEDPRFYLPEKHADSVYGYEFKGVRSSIRIDTASGRGIGRSDRNDDVYCIELADWESSTAEDALANLLTSQPVGSTETRFTVDFNANTNWASSHAYVVWEQARKGQNSFHAFFSGTKDMPELYTPKFLQERLSVLGPKRFKTDYPETPEDLYVQSDIAVFDSCALDDAVGAMGGKYAGNACSTYVLGVDTATGNPEGDYQACVVLGLREVDGKKYWDEVCEPIHGHWPEDIFAGMVHDLAERYPGCVVVERNVGSAVLITLRNLGTRGLYRHRHRDKTGKQRYELGFDTTRASKRILISDAIQMLECGEVGLMTPALVQELREFEWKLRDDGSEGPGLAGAPDRTGAHDDLAMAWMLALAGIGQVGKRWGQ